MWRNTDVTRSLISLTVSTLLFAMVTTPSIIVVLMNLSNSERSLCLWASSKETVKEKILMVTHFKVPYLKVILNCGGKFKIQDLGLERCFPTSRFMTRRFSAYPEFLKEGHQSVSPVAQWHDYKIYNGTHFDWIQPHPVSQLSSGRTWDQPSDNPSGLNRMDIHNTGAQLSEHGLLLPTMKGRNCPNNVELLFLLLLLPDNGHDMIWKSHKWPWLKIFVLDQSMWLCLVSFRKGKYDTKIFKKLYLETRLEMVNSKIQGLFRMPRYQRLIYLYVNTTSLTQSPNLSVQTFHQI